MRLIILFFCVVIFAALTVALPYPEDGGVSVKDPKGNNDPAKPQGGKQNGTEEESSSNEPANENPEEGLNGNPVKKRDGAPTDEETDKEGVDKPETKPEAKPEEQPKNPVDEWSTENSQNKRDIVLVAGGSNGGSQAPEAPEAPKDEKSDAAPAEDPSKKDTESKASE